MPIVRTVRVMEGETVEIEWTLRDGSGVYIERYTIPPKPVRESRRLDVVGGPGGKATTETVSGG